MRRTRREQISYVRCQQLAERIQLGIEYYPDPPFGPRTVDEASDEAKAKIVDFEKRGEEILASIPRLF